MAELQVRVTPKASQEKVVVIDNKMRVWVTAPPAEGQANQALINLLAKALGLPKSAFEIGRGGKSRDKRVLVSGITQERLDELVREMK